MDISNPKNMATIQKGKFIVVEGPDGMGKSSIVYDLLPILEEIFKEQKKQFYLTREPGGTYIGDQIREILLKQDMDPLTETLLFAAARNEHTEKVIVPLLETGVTVISDRYLASSMIYQGMGYGLKQRVGYANANCFVIPDLEIVLHAPLEVAKERIKDSNRLDKLGTQQEIFDHYKEYAAVNEHAVLVDASQPYEKVLEECVRVIMEKLFE